MLLRIFGDLVDFVRTKLRCSRIRWSFRPSFWVVTGRFVCPERPSDGAKRSKARNERMRLQETMRLPDMIMEVDSMVPWMTMKIRISNRWYFLFHFEIH